MSKERPPLGLRPKEILDKHRAIEILEAMDRYVRAGKLIPEKWVNELSHIYMEA